MLQQLIQSDDKESLTSLDLGLAGDWREEWEFIDDDDNDDDDVLRRNISYHLQYLDFLIRLYNHFYIYATIESLLCKNILVNTNSIIEASLEYTVKKASNNPESIERIKYLDLINIAAREYQIISSDMANLLHWLRKQRNLQHFQSGENRELDNYSIDDANKAIKLLESYRKQLKKYYKKRQEKSLNHQHKH
jgi:HEPN domain-containing protein